MDLLPRLSGAPGRSRIASPRWTASGSSSGSGRRPHGLEARRDRDRRTGSGGSRSRDLMRGRVDELEVFAARASSDGLRTAVLLGMGGSSLAPEVLVSTFGAADGALELHRARHHAPGDGRAAYGRARPGRDALRVSPASPGPRPRRVSHLAHFWALLPRRRRVRRDHRPRDAARGARARARLPRVFAQPAGHRRPLLGALVLRAGPRGADRRPARTSCSTARTRCAEPAAAVRRRPRTRAPRSAPRSARRRSAGPRQAHARPAARRSPRFGDWVEQLIAESTGKEGAGIIPVVGEPLGGAEVYGADRLFVALGDHGAAVGRARGRRPPRRPDRARRPGRARRRVLPLGVRDRGRRPRPRDQPVRPAQRRRRPRTRPRQILASGRRSRTRGSTTLGALLAARAAGRLRRDHGLPRPDARDRGRAAAARSRLRDRHRVATTVGFGPRFLHSTGQLHKGGPNSGVFLQVVDARRETDVRDPGTALHVRHADRRPGRTGDLRSLRARGRRVARVTLDALMEVI